MSSSSQRLMMTESCSVFLWSCFVLFYLTTGSGLPGVEDDLIFSGAGSGCNGDDEDECPALPETGSGDDDLITPVYVPPSKPPPTVKPKITQEGKGCDDDDECVDGSGSGENTEEPSSSSKPGIITEITDSTYSSLDNTSTKSTPDEGSTTSVSQHTTGTSYSTVYTTDSGTSSTTVSVSVKPQQIPTLIVSTEMISSTTTPTTEKDKYIGSMNEINHGKSKSTAESNYNINNFNYNPSQNQNKLPPKIHSETSEVVALIIGIIAGALIAVILIILIILKFKSRQERSFKIDDSKEYQHGPNAALLGSTGSNTNGQTQYQLNGALRNGDKGQMQQQKTKKRDSKDIKEWYV